MNATVHYCEDFRTWDVWNGQQNLGSYETREEAGHRAAIYNAVGDDEPLDGILSPRHAHPGPRTEIPAKKMSR